MPVPVGNTRGAKGRVANVAERVMGCCTVTGINVELDPRRAAGAGAREDKQILDTDLVSERGNLGPRKHVPHRYTDHVAAKWGRVNGYNIVVGILRVLGVHHGK